MAENKSKPERIENIIAAAISEIYEKEYENTSVDAIAVRAGLSKGGVYHHYKNKEEIFIDVSDEIRKQFFLIIERSNGNLNTYDELKNFIWNYLEYWQNHKKELKLIYLLNSKKLTDKQFQKKLQMYSVKISSYLEKLLIKGTISGIFKKHNTFNRAVMIFVSLEGILPYLISNENFSITDAADNIETAFLKEIIQIK